MKDKKHIDELFKDRFKNFEASPSPHVWNQIQAKLQEEKEDRKVIPLWWKLSGVAALLALLLTIGSTFFNPFTPTDTITTEDVDTTIPEDSNTQNNPLIHDYINKSDVASEEIENPTTTDDTSEAASENNNVIPQNKKDAVLKKSNASKNAIAVEKNSEKGSGIKNNKTNNIGNTTSEGVTTQKDAVATTTNSETNSVKEAAKLEKDALKKNNDLIKKEAGIEETTKVAVATETETKKQNTSDSQNTETDIAAKEKESKKRSILDAINEKNEEAVATVNNKPENRWDVAPNFAPVYYNSLGQGSSIDPAFSDNTKSGDVNFSYGVQVSYNINDRLSIRSGVNNVDLSYATGGLELGTAPVSIALKSINYGDKQSVVTAVDKGTLGSMQNPNDPFGSIMPKSTSGDVELIQSISYYEIPMELKYAVLTNKFGINLIGGFSTLLLGNNEVSVKAGDFNDTLGEANNLSSVSFTTNVGLGFDYKISKKLKFNIEPMFKYQLNPYTDSSVNFKPYYVGIYSGLSFKF